MSSNSFPATQWTMIVQKSQGSLEEKGLLISSLCEIYWKPLYFFLRHSGKTQEDAEDLVQGFFAKLITAESLLKLDRKAGSLRSYLLKSIKNFSYTETDKEKALKRGGTYAHFSIDTVGEETVFESLKSDGLSPSTLFDKRWALLSIELAMKKLENEYKASGNGTVFSVLAKYLDGRVEAGAYKEIARQLELTQGAARAALFRLRQRFRLCFDDVLKETVTDLSEVAAESKNLRLALIS